jgi:hypothetical protein
MHDMNSLLSSKNGLSVILLGQTRPRLACSPVYKVIITIVQFVDIFLRE